MKKISSLLPALLCLMCSGAVLNAQDYTAYMKAVEQRNAAYLAERYNVDVAEAMTTAARIFNDPSLSVAYGNNQDWSLQMGQSVEAELSYGFSLGNVRRARINVARSEEDITRAAVEDWFRNLKADATLAWLSAQEARSILEVKRSSYEGMRQVAASDSLKAVLGDGSQVDARQSRIEAQALQRKRIMSTPSTNFHSMRAACSSGIFLMPMWPYPCLLFRRRNCLTLHWSTVPTFGLPNSPARSRNGTWLS